MSQDDPFEGLDVPDDPTADLDRATQQLTVRTEKRRYDKPMTVVEGFEGSTDLDDLASQLKSAVGAGGTVKDDAIEVQGDHRDRVSELLEERGFQVA
ncbi:translation initiation factor [Natronomonas salina]|uniref:translation initiation factor n=1 Tax=Natronomonas salina TaxID=1710540 RepID=UPI0015B395A6|nr:translation initiation factor [Natronomonas salina]QLD88982.1 translation initiation factor [Natronomonas salina]